MENRSNVARATRHLVAASIALGMTSAGAGDESGAVWYVDRNAGGGGDGLSWGAAFDDLQSALAAASSGDQIWVAGEPVGATPPIYMSGYAPGASGDTSATFELASGVELYGGFAGTESTRGERQLGVYLSILTGDLDGDDIRGTFGNNSRHVVTAAGVDATAVLDGFHIVTGRAVDRPGDDDGGGLHCTNGSPTIRNCFFGWNQAYGAGGAIAMYGGSSPRVSNTIFALNAADTGAGAVYVASGSAPEFLNCVFWANAHLGGNGEAGAMYVTDESSARIVNCTVTRNTTTQNYSAIFVHPNATATTLIANSIVWDNQENAGKTPLGLGPMSVEYSNTAPVETGPGNISADPGFVDAVNGVVELTAGSPSIDAANSCAYDGPYFDASWSQGRFVDDPGVANTGSGDLPQLDMGAFEFACVASTCPGDIDGNGIVDVSDLLALLGSWGVCP